MWKRFGKLIFVAMLMLAIVVFYSTNKIVSAKGKGSDKGHRESGHHDAKHDHDAGHHESGHHDAKHDHDAGHHESGHHDAKHDHDAGHHESGHHDAKHHD